jgi:hypothetical protein
VVNSISSDSPSAFPSTHALDHHAAANSLAATQSLGLWRLYASSHMLIAITDRSMGKADGVAEVHLQSSAWPWRAQGQGCSCFSRHHMETLLLSHRSRGKAGQGADDMRNATKAGDEKNRLVRVPEESLHSATSLLI